MAEAAAAGHLSGDGRFTARCHAYLEQSLGVRKALLTTNCTHALEMTALLLDIKAGDEAILPAYTFVSVVNAFVLRGATPVFADVRPDTLNLDESRLETLITPRTRAIVPVHYAGVACEMDAIRSIASSAGIAVVEDNAHGRLLHQAPPDLRAVESRAKQQVWIEDRVGAEGDDVSLRAVFTFAFSPANSGGHGARVLDLGCACA